MGLGAARKLQNGFKALCGVGDYSGRSLIKGGWGEGL